MIFENWFRRPARWFLEMHCEEGKSREIWWGVGYRR